MKPHFHAVLVGLLVTLLLAGCSIRTVPLEEEQRIYEDETDIYDSLPPGFFYDAWQRSQYRQYYGDVPELGYPPSFRLNIDPNPHDSYRADEKPVQRAPAQTSIQGTTSNRRVGERQDPTAVQQRVNRSRHTRSNRLASESTEDRTRVRERLRQRHRQRTVNTAEDDEDRKTQRRTTRRRARR